MLTTTSALVAAAHAAHTGVAAFNVIAIEHAEAVARAAEETGLPAILQISENAARHHGDVAPLAAAVAAIARASRAELSLHLDHVEDADLLHRTAECGASSVMFDASRRSDEDNVLATRAAADWAHEQGLFIEAELGEIGGKKGSAHTPGVRTDPEQARDFVAATGVDALAVAVGSSHAMTDRTARLDLDLVARIAAAVPVPLVLHGSSGVPADLLGAAVRRGMTKVNFGTRLNVAFTGAVRAALAAAPDAHDPRPYLANARTAVAAEAADCLRTVSVG
ncbi:class II fructose-bisphosphate aldolase [Streptomyces sp. 8L]|uniref:class II fructose-bisphosphate aldolase n=1 Tax=Streptomyces sp. 8L TaxID=2877242 RepID=UPI001CD1B98D|nr:class II fructose-bisphosphate aldolase [Streptomyces sp. 8L]MCA1223654.1 class II fructose-bisphosphate aldolase [Streptomyces sp. 8L]